MFKLTDSYPFLLNRVGVRLGDLFARRIASYGVTVPMYRVMTALREAGNQRLNDLAGMTSIEISTLSRLVGSMEKLELLSRSRMENNARSVEIKLTSRGETMIEELMPMAKHFEDVAIAHLSQEKRDMLKEILIDIYERLEVIEP
ncbi:MarR family transcriptional regulator [Pseudomonas sp. PAMC 29040]|uniref:MarR family winged helix-turn-helix transcriptional regulator n=1 Tax=Pseudomonas sp. PAMC 29040 TaxID=2498450 RepID=UPI000FA1B938|nr:MarR family winged helix-turn-helix transcriptional regulator [Pseudomonas sp. PAMC 29040]RUT42415.1 MarR family transcriptional regulator [Pseudomonas sp. PAMC 29040]